VPENQEDIDALLAEVNALADEAVADIVGEETAQADPVVEPSLDASSSGGSVSADAFDPGQTPIRPSATRTTGGEDISRILKLQVPVIVQLAGNTMPLSGIMGLTTGAIIEFDKPVDSDLDLLINNKCIGQGQAVKVGENFGLRITQVGSLRDRIQAMGSK
jgi:flagellar motor switch protein FliN/FliY